MLSGSEMLRLKAVKMETIVRLEKRLKKWNPLNVIPMVMRYQHVGVDPAIALDLCPAVAEHAQPCAAIENEASAVRGG